MAKPPPIRIGCECGESGHAAYGEIVDLPVVRRAAGTPRRSRPRPTTGAAAGCAALELEIVGPRRRSSLVVFVPLVLFVDSAFLFAGLVVAAAWMFLYMPFWRRRVRRAAGEAPTWELHPE